MAHGVFSYFFPKKLWHIFLMPDFLNGRYDSAQRSYAPPHAPACAAVSPHTETHNRLDNARETRDDGTRAARSENCPRNQRALALAGGGVNAKPSNTISQIYSINGC